MKYRNEETGKVVDVMPGTILPKIYKKVQAKSAEKEPVKTEDTNQVDVTATANAKPAKKPAAKSAEKEPVRTEVTDPVENS